jgi:predicted phosphodiesterase
MVGINIVSDLHLEFRKMKFKNLFLHNADILCLAGDICACGTKEDMIIFIEFIKFISPKYKHIIHVAGNHEYYTAGESKINQWHTMQSIERRFRSLSRLIPNYTFLNCGTKIVTVNGKSILFIGATLWSFVDPNNRKEVELRMNDYSHIYYNKAGTVTRFNANYMTSLFIKHSNFIKNEVAKAKIPAVVITHHKPIREKNDTISQAYETNITSYISIPRTSVKYAFHGHTHEKYDKKIKGVRYISNPKGYILQHTGFKPDLVLTL